VIGLGWDGQYKLRHGINKVSGIDESLLQEFKKADSQPYKRALTEAVVRRKVEDVIPFLYDIVTNRSEDLEWRKRCSIFLSWLVFHNSIDNLISLLKMQDLESTLRMQCIKGLSYMAGFSLMELETADRQLIIGTLTETLKDKSNDVEVREEALECLHGLVADDKLWELESHLLPT